MSTSLWFVVPVHGRLPLAAICLQQLHRTCQQLGNHNVDATAVIVGTRDDLLELHNRTGLVSVPGHTRAAFAGYIRDNQATSRKFNDGIQAACDPTFNAKPADYVVPCGSDDWVHHDLFTDLPDAVTVVGFQRISFVREDGRELTVRNLAYEGGSGIRIYPRQVMARANYRPADEDRQRGCDTSILRNLSAVSEQQRKHLRVEHRDADPRLIVDWKTPGQQLNPYQSVSGMHRELESGDPFEMLAGVYHDRVLRDMRRHYNLDRQMVTA